MLCLAACLLAFMVSADPDDCVAEKQIDAVDIFVRGDTGFQLAKMAQYGKLCGPAEESDAKLNPGMVVYCSQESHVQSAVRFAVRCGYKVVVRSGGHSYTASSSCNAASCMQLDLTAMNNTAVDGRIITTGPGIMLGDFAKFTMKHNLSVPHGGCSKVGVGGHYQSSAWGMMSHSHGSGLDFVESFRMVLANGSVGEFSRDGQNETVYKSVLGSAPGSWGIITQYKMKGVLDSEVPHTRVLYTSILYSRQNFVEAWKHAQFVVMDQEQKNLRDLKIIVLVGPPSDLAWTDASDAYITVVGFWTGIDSGRMTPEWEDLYWARFRQFEHKPFPLTYDISAPLSLVTQRLIMDYKNNDDRYAVQAIHSDRWWSDEFTELMADEMDKRMALMPEIYPSWQFLPLGLNSQWARNDGMNSITWRDTRAYVDDWMFTKNESRYAEMVALMVDFREKTRRFWQYSDGSDRSTWMSPPTTYKGSTDLRNATVAKAYFPNTSQFEQVQALKSELDPTDLFSNLGTIPLRDNMQDVAVV